MAVQAQRRTRLFHKAVALPQEHGTWAFLLSPLIIGLYVGGRWNTATLFLILGVLIAFFFRQPIVMIVKVLSGRRPRSLLPVALFWAGIYGLLGIGVLAWFWMNGMGYLLYLAIPAVLVFVWHLYLIHRRAERGQMGVEIVASGTLALAAPAALWVARGYADPTGWLLWLLCWFQSAASIVYIYTRLEQRRRGGKASSRSSWRSLLYVTFNMVVVAALGVAGVLSPWLWLAYAVQWVETVWGIWHPAVGWRPTAIGLRQLAVSTLFTVVFLLTW